MQTSSCLFSHCHIIHVKRTFFLIYTPALRTLDNCAIDQNHIIGKKPYENGGKKHNMTYIAEIWKLTLPLGIQTLHAVQVESADALTDILVFSCPYPLDLFL